MPKLPKLLSATVAAALLAASAAPAEARGFPRSGGWHHGGGGWNHGGWGRGYRGYRGHPGYGYRYRRGPDFGDVLLGALVVGGVAAVASEAIRADRERNRDRDYDRDGDRGDRRDWSREDAAAETCADAVERQAGGSARVESVRDVRADGAGFRVEGDIALDSRSDRSDLRSFICGVRGERADFVQIGEQTSWR